MKENRDIITPKLVFYFAYGSNMSSRVFKSGFRKMNPVSAQKALAHGYKFAFTEPGIPFLEPAFANIENDPSCVCEGVLYQITLQELDALDKSEGNRAYNIIDIFVTTHLDGKRVVAKTFQSKMRVCGLLPTKRYLDLIIAGAREHQLSDYWIQMLEESACVDRSYLARYFPLTMRIFHTLNTLGPLNPLQLWKIYRARIR